MINTDTIWQLEEKVEDAFAAYLTAYLNDSKVFVGVAFSTAKYKEPGVYVGAEESDNVAENASFNGYRACSVSIVIRSHADTDSDANLGSSRAQHGAYKSRVIRALAQTDLVASINAVIDQSARVDMAEIGQVQRSVDADNNAFQTVVTVACYARPVED